VAVIVGDADVLTPPDRAKEIADAIPQAHLTILPGVGHMSAMEAPEEIAAVLLRLEAEATS
jgi:pimeloyl-ACP methyl ester carboxylesterase